MIRPFLLKAPCKDYLWGGNRLREYGKESDADKIAESWELSCHPDGESIIASGEFTGMTLAQLICEHSEVLGPACDKFIHRWQYSAFIYFPVLIKLIDARDNLSVQVHPDDEYARRNEWRTDRHGKTEMWYILDAEPGAEILYGFKKRLTKEEFRRAIEENTLLDKVQHVPVKPGELYFIPAGTLHAIGKGILIAEIQESSNLTYRIYDYGRVGADGKPRELHIEKALDVTELRPVKPVPPGPVTAVQGVSTQVLGKCKYFCTTKFTLGDWHFYSEISFQHLLILSGVATMTLPGGERLYLQKGSSVFIPAGAEAVVEGECELICTTIEP